MQLPTQLVTLADTATRLFVQLDANQGTQVAQKGAVQRLSEPTYYDFMFPALAFCLVILLPSTTAMWVIWKTLREKKGEPDET